MAMQLIEASDEAAFLGLERLDDGGAVAQARLAATPALQARVDLALGWMLEDGAMPSPALVALLVGLVGSDARTVVVDMVEAGLDHATQEAVIAYLRRASDLPQLFLMIRSSAVLDLAAMRADEAILFCPANHSPPKYGGALSGRAVPGVVATRQVT
ncbi:MAG: hypothetical protein MO852_03860 [Candidatus Devosia euplotis]|nr:hypothetical protein [Candidatus Devosia euplotis]